MTDGSPSPERGVWSWPARGIPSGTMEGPREKFDRKAGGNLVSEMLANEA